MQCTENGQITQGYDAEMTRKTTETITVVFYVLLFQMLIVNCCLFLKSRKSAQWQTSDVHGEFKQCFAFTFDDFYYFPAASFVFVF